MSERSEVTHYRVVDEEGDAITVTFLHRYCRCGSPDCVKDEIAIVLPGDPDDCPCRVQVPKLMTQYLEGLFNGWLKVDHG